jgi:hypothetical protein
VPDRHEPDGRGRAARGALVAAFLLAASVLTHAGPPPLHLESRPAPGGIVLRASVPPGADSSAQRRETLDALARGLRAEIMFHIRVYVPSPGPMGFLGDRLLSESTISRTARWDPFSERFVMTEAADGEEQESVSKADGQELLDAFFVMERSVALPDSLRPGEAPYLTGRYRYNPVKLDGILTLVGLWGDLRRRTSPWSRLDVGAPR